MAKIYLPEEVLLQQRCTLCDNPLSVGPVKVSSAAEIICGRSTCQYSIIGNTQVSIYNILAAACLFKCVYSGCEKMLAFNEAEEHEKTCNKRIFYDCHFCFYNGNKYAIMFHYKKKHPAYKINQDTLNNNVIAAGINHINAILKMSDPEVRQFIDNMPKVLLPSCQNCKIRIKERKNLFFCPQLHMACEKCVTTKCTRCVEIFPWNKDSVLDKILLECEWEGCSEKRNIFEYVWHKQICTSRQYKCPCPSCGYVSCLDDLKKHWHIFPPLNENQSIKIYPTQVYYWLSPLYKEIIEVIFHLTPDRIATVTINQKNTIVPVDFCLRYVKQNGVSYQFLDHINNNRYQRNTFVLPQEVSYVLFERNY